MRVNPGAEIVGIVSRETSGETVTREAVLRLYPALGEVDATEFGAAWRDGTSLLRLPRGAALFSPGQACGGFPLLLEGEARVFRMAPNGRQLELYRLSAGEVCLVSSASLFTQAEMSAFGQTVTPTTVWMLPPELFALWLDKSPPFRRFVLGQYTARLTELSELVDALAFQRLDQRLAQALLGQGPVLAVTHQQLADRLGTAREIVTRLLRRFEQAGWVAVSREHIELLQPAALRQLAAGEFPP